MGDSLEIRHPTNGRTVEAVVRVIEDLHTTLNWKEAGHEFRIIMPTETIRALSKLLEPPSTRLGCEMDVESPSKRNLCGPLVQQIVDFSLRLNPDRLPFFFDDLLDKFFDSVPVEPLMSPLPRIAVYTVEQGGFGDLIFNLRAAKTIQALFPGLMPDIFLSSAHEDVVSSYDKLASGTGLHSNQVWGLPAGRSYDLLVQGPTYSRIDLSDSRPAGISVPFSKF